MGSSIASHIVLHCCPCRYPKEKPEKYYDLDQEFRDFINCVPCRWPRTGVLGGGGGNVRCCGDGKHTVARLLWQGGGGV
jgi:hypothetical protein